MSDPFLSVTKVNTENAAMTETLKAALQQRQNKVYTRDEVGNDRLTFRMELANGLAGMKINKDVDFSCIYPGVAFACTFIACAVLAVEWMRQGQCLRGVLLVYSACVRAGSPCI